MTTEDREAKHPTARPMAVNTAGDGRESAMHTLDDMIRRTERDLERLQALRRALPQQMPPEADEALWLIFCQSRRHL